MYSIRRHSDKRKKGQLKGLERLHEYIQNRPDNPGKAEEVNGQKVRQQILEQEYHERAAYILCASGDDKEEYVLLRNSNTSESSAVETVLISSGIVELSEYALSKTDFADDVLRLATGGVYRRSQWPKWVTIEEGKLSANYAELKFPQLYTEAQLLRAYKFAQGFADIDDSETWVALTDTLRWNPRAVQHYYWVRKSDFIKNINEEKNEFITKSGELIVLEPNTFRQLSSYYKITNHQLTTKSSYKQTQSMMWKKPDEDTKEQLDGHTSMLNTKP